MKRPAFTLIELLVVITIVILLMGILIPAVNMAREAARRTQCVSRQRDLAMAMITYNNANNCLPGYLNQIGQTPIHSWAVAIFPMIGENKRYEVLMKDCKPEVCEYPNCEQPPGCKYSNDIHQAIVPLPALLCPSDNPREDKRLNYIVNCGPVEWIDDDIVLALSLFRDRRIPLNSINTKVKLEEIPDGASNTILLSENISKTNVWWDGDWHNNVWHNWSPLPSTASGSSRDVSAVEKLGFFWSLSGQNAYAPNSPIDKPRPASKHPATIVVAYADGSAKPISDDISPGDWIRATCPDDAKLKNTKF